MAVLTKSNIFGVIREDTEGVLKDLTAGSQFLKMREGFSFSGSVETIATDELVGGDIGASKSFISKEAPSGSVPLYLKHSGVEAQLPEYLELVTACMGEDAIINATEYTSLAGTTVSKIVVSDGTQFAIGQALLIKDQFAIVVLRESF